MNALEQKNRLLTLIGENVVSFQLLELHLAEYLSSMLKLNDFKHRYIFFDSMSYKQKVDLLFSLYEADPDKVERTKGKAKFCLLKASEFRNKIVHSIWSVSDEPLVWHREKPNIKGRPALKNKVSYMNFELFQNGNQAIKDLHVWTLNTENQLEQIYDTLENCIKDI